MGVGRPKNQAMANLLFFDLETTGVLYWKNGIRLKRSQIEELAMNDGFESVDQFFAWFNKDWKGKIIHWTDLKY